MVLQTFQLLLMYLHYVWSTLKCHHCLTLLPLVYCEISLLGQPIILFALRLDSSTISIKALRTVLPLLSFKGLTSAYLVKTPIAYKNFLTFRFLQDNDPISVI